MLTFEQLSKIQLKTESLRDNYSHEFWEQLYQLFKQRFIQEQNDELKKLMEKHP